MIIHKDSINQANDKMVVICCSCRLSKNISYLALKVKKDVIA